MAMVEVVTTWDWVTLIIDWAEKLKAPDQVIASKTVQGKIITKTIFPYPKL